MTTDEALAIPVAELRPALEAVLMVADEPLDQIALASAVGYPEGDVAAALGDRLGRRSGSAGVRGGGLGVDRVVRLKNRPPRLVHGILVDLELLVQFVDEPFVGPELPFVRNPDARHLARHSGSPAFISEDLESAGRVRPTRTTVKRNPVCRTVSRHRQGLA